MALWGTMTAGEFVVLRLHRRWPDGRWLINLLTHASLALELLYPILIWVRIARPLMLAGMAWRARWGSPSMSPGLAEFSLAMLAANLAFVSGLVAAPAGRRPGPAAAAGPLRRGLPAVPGVDGAGHGRGSGRRHRADRPDRGRRADRPSRLDARGLPAVDARGLRPRAGSRPGSTPCGRSRAGCRSSGRWPRSLTSRGSHRSAGSCTITSRPLGRATSLAPTRPAESIPGRREPCLASSEVTHHNPHNPITAPADSQEMPHP